MTAGSKTKEGKQMVDGRGQIAAKQERRDEGFSLTEMLVILVICSILAGVVIVGVKNLLGYRAQAAARLLVSDIGYAKKMAETTQVKSGIVFYPGQERYVVYQTTFTIPLGEPLTNKPMVRDFTIGDFRKVNIVSAEFPIGSAIEFVEFDPRGRNIYGGRVVFAYGADTFFIDMEANTGKAAYAKQ